jgi:hypothetical protein
LVPFYFQYQIGFVRGKLLFEKSKWLAGTALGAGWHLGAGFGNRTVGDHLAVLCARRWGFLVSSGGAVYCFQPVSGENKVGTGVNELYRFRKDASYSEG